MEQKTEKMAFHFKYVLTKLYYNEIYHLEIALPSAYYAFFNVQIKIFMTFSLNDVQSLVKATSAE